jgi:hypothetical protein
MARQTLTVQATTRGSAHGLYSELGSDRQVREIFYALDLYRDSHSVDPVVSSVATACGDRHYSFNLT